MNISKETILKFDRPGPRYTSYPTAPEWSGDLHSGAYEQKLAEFGRNAKTLSLYVHIPFCESLCYFCACTMNVRSPEAKHGDEYLDHLSTEIELTAQRLGRRKFIRQLHWGGGTPSFLTENQMRRLFDLIAERFDIDPKGEIAIEVDPRRVTYERVRALRELGFNRISIGLQDFDPVVQKHVNRIQPYEMVERFNGWCRELQFPSVNFDLIYGLPYQTKKSFHQTMEQVLRLRPDRVALYSFAYVPWLKKHQTKFDKDSLPDTDTKLEIFLAARQAFLANGYEAIAMDHFALESDELSRAFHQGTLYRNFMGYTVKPADEYIGLGTSAISFLEGGYFQNYKTIPEYYRFLKQRELPVERGKILSTDDLIRQWAINSLMCRFRLDKVEFSQRFQTPFDIYFSEEQEHLRQCLRDQLLAVDGNTFTVTPLGKLFIRNICMGFDWYLRQQNAHTRFSRTV